MEGERGRGRDGGGERQGDTDRGERGETGREREGERGGIDRERERGRGRREGGETG